MLGAAKKMARNLLRLKERARRSGVPVIYVNDNFGKWKSDFRVTIEHCLGEKVRGREVARILQPEEDDYFVLKPKHSGFFSTTLETLLRYLGSKTARPDRDCGEFLRPFHSERRLHARLRPGRATRLHRLEHAAGKRGRARADAEVSQGKNAVRQRRRFPA